MVYLASLSLQRSGCVKLMRKTLTLGKTTSKAKPKIKTHKSY